MAYDSRRGSIVMFGGWERLADTWEHDGKLWREIQVNGARPSMRNGHSMAYDSRRGVTVLYAGFLNNNRFDDMWEWDGAAWTQVDMQGSPDQNGAIVYDEARDVLVFFGRAEGKPRIGPHGNGTVLDGFT